MHSTHSASTVPAAVTGSAGLYVGRETPLIRARLHDSHSGTEEVSPMATEARLLFDVSLSHS